MYREGSRRYDFARFARTSLTSVCDSIYVMELAVVTVAAAAVGSRGRPVVLDTGDAPFDFLTLVEAGRSRVLSAKALEATAYGISDEIIVRGQYHEVALRQRHLKRVRVVPDGVDLGIFIPTEDRELRRRLGLEGAFTVGIQGHFTWYTPVGGGLGSELIQAIALLRNLPVHAVVIGDGVGISHLRLLAAKLGVADRLHVIGRVPYRELPRYLGLCDVCLLTQTNDPSSWVRTTGKLPGYLATGRYILASRVGTAADILPEEMLIDYQGHWDEEYPAKLADRLDEVYRDPERAAKGLELRSLATKFDYDSVAHMAAEAVRDAVAEKR